MVEQSSGTTRTEESVSATAGDRGPEIRDLITRLRHEGGGLFDEAADALARPVADRSTYEAWAAEIEIGIAEIKADNERLRSALLFVSTDPCYQHLGSVTHDQVRAVIDRPAGGS